MNYNTEKLEKNCRKMLNEFEDQLTWKWDERFGTVLAEFDVGNKESVSNIIKIYMGDIWDNGNSKTAPEVVQTVINYFGGLSHGQQLFTSDPKGDDLVLCALWPWGNGKTISIRMGVFAEVLSDDDNEELTKEFKGWFNL
jgi:hypothetical protein